MTIRLPWRAMPESRQERSARRDNPTGMTPEEIAADEILGLENRNRYIQQSKTGELPPRPQLHTFTQESHR